MPRPGPKSDRIRSPQKRLVIDDKPEPPPKFLTGKEIRRLVRLPAGATWTHVCVYLYDSYYVPETM